MGHVGNGIDKSQCPQSFKERGISFPTYIFAVEQRNFYADLPSTFSRPVLDPLEATTGPKAFTADAWSCI